MKSFKELGLSKKILGILEEMRFTSPTEIQEKAIPPSLEGKDIVGSSATGSGKTLAFTLGIIEKLEKGKGPQLLVLTPTRELACQITKVIRNLTKQYALKVTEVYGGVSISPQIYNIPKSEIIVGTPGRILDHLERKTLDLFDLKFLVLDEADRMSDMGFLPDVKKIISQCPIKRQTSLFSATISSDVNYITKKYMKNPEFISAESYVDPSKLIQYYYDVPKNLKFSSIVYLLKKEKSKLIMIFCNTRMNSDSLTLNLKRYGFEAEAIHGGLAQNKRSRLMEGFHKGEIHILVCTDVAARGLDIKGISHVYNYDIPKTSDEYIHRIGRTARAGKEGLAISIVTDNDYENFRNVMRDDSLKIERKEIPGNIEKLTPRFSNEGFSNGRHGRGDRRNTSQRFSSGRFRRGDRRDTSRRFSSNSRRPGGSSRGRDHRTQRNSRFSKRRRY
ncbi:MAG: DEAD/DEAH box helicase [Nanoarchaeota archaeon]|nr:DEAD/DEAH box helicase [Nanoarchaeota archaeon]